ncbi:N-alpha-acetyltransferase, 35 NatC auxiliary subunit homolog [Eurytemora carolleeae]|uniref:N-alpha-acetyltransferase, 35 NatC auxiliary subunit homolog n=1 Tax=Eurytemora carolleeae TaxID=1294199 RepID=UPI000C76B4F0|nr:N-alpha-acetyltransferase, 35 NatC auxiliary subunit homolog [Eurytemora carolleeae]|eukprot:XP_023336172.1 N-alpha-acetyltransferase, 35 NatC auxiliary subunit homolog [Eurytemora affinis]
MFKLLVAAKKEGKILSPSPDFDNEAVRYDHRFAAFGGLLTPPLAPYSQYKDVLGLTEEINAKDLYLIASRDFAQARQVLESVQQACDGDTDTKNLITVCKTNLIVSSVLAKDSQNRTLTFDFSLHPSFPIIKLS